MLIESKLRRITGQFFQHWFAYTYNLVQAFYLDGYIALIFDYV